MAKDKSNRANVVFMPSGKRGLVEKGTTILIATHDYEIIKKFNSRIIKCSEKKLHEITIDEL